MKNDEGVHDQRNGEEEEEGEDADVVVAMMMPVSNLGSGAKA